MPRYDFRCGACGQVYGVVRPVGRAAEALGCLIDGTACDPVLSPRTPESPGPAPVSDDWFGGHTHAEGIALWSDVLMELRQRIGPWTRQLRLDGIRGGDVLFACVTPAIEMYGNFARVIDAEGRIVPLDADRDAAEPHERGYLAYVWETLSRAALADVFGTSVVRSGSDPAESIDPDVRLTALLLLWALPPFEDAARVDAPDDEDPAWQRLADAGLAREVVASFARPLGVDLDEWEGRIVQTDPVLEIVRLRSLSERATELFGADGGVPSHATTLDRLHAAMFLARAGRIDALSSLIRDEEARGPSFMRLVTALAGLYPAGSEERRTVEAVLRAVRSS